MLPISARFYLHASCAGAAERCHHALAAAMMEWNRSRPDANKLWLDTSFGESPMPPENGDKGALARVFVQASGYISAHHELFDLDKACHSLGEISRQLHAQAEAMNLSLVVEHAVFRAGFMCFARDQSGEVVECDPETFVPRAGSPTFLPEMFRQ